MTDKPDTAPTREAVERLAGWMDNAAASTSSLPKTHSAFSNAATTLRALAAERDALRAELDGVAALKDSAMRSAALAHESLHSLAAQNDALRAEVAALRQAVERARGEALEEAAGIADEHTQPSPLHNYGPARRSKEDLAYSFAAQDIAFAIRARAGGAGNE
jgi:ABC-type transporter Mla subunit MlaD